MTEMGRGINLGNTYELVANDRDPAATARMMDMFWDKGFRNVRVPVTWWVGWASFALPGLGMRG